MQPLTVPDSGFKSVIIADPVILIVQNHVVSVSTKSSSELLSRLVQPFTPPCSSEFFSSYVSVALSVVCRHLAWPAGREKPEIKTVRKLIPLNKIVRKSYFRFFYFIF